MGLQLSDLGANVTRDSCYFYCRQFSCLTVEFKCLLKGNPEFVLFQTRGNVWVGPGINIRIDPE